MSTPTMQFNTRLPVDEYNLLAAIAETERISMVTVLRDAIRERAKRLGLMQTAAQTPAAPARHRSTSFEPIHSEMADIAAKTLANLGGGEWDTKKK